MTRLWMSLLAAAFFVSGCGDMKNPLEKENKDKDEDEEESFEPINTPGYGCDPLSVVTYENFAEGWLTRQCVSCHSSDLVEGTRANAPIGVDFNTYEQVRFWANRMFLRAAYDNETMPPAGGPYPEDRILFGEWLACQAPREQDVDQD